MKSDRKLFRRLTVAILFVLFTAGAGIGVYALEENPLDHLIGGVTEVLYSTDGSGAEIIQATVDKLQIDMEAVREAQPKLVMTNVTKSLNVRSEPNENATKVGKLYKDCGGTILEKGDGWTKLQSGNVVGWCSNEFLVFGPEAQKMAEEVGMNVATVNTETLRVRSAPTTDSKILGLVEKGDAFETVDDSDDEWVCIDYEGADGYLSAEWLVIEFKVDAGETIEEIKAREKKEAEAKRKRQYDAFMADGDTAKLLAALVQCEAGSEGYDGQLAVASVVMNRVRSGAYPDSIHGVIFASGQFPPAANGKVMNLYNSGRINANCLKAAQEAINGTSNVGSATHFRRNDGRNGYVIGNHVFY